MCMCNSTTASKPRPPCKGVIDHVQEPELVAQAQQRLDAINASEVQQLAPPAEDELELPLPANTDGQ
jgi:hypothetical protein